MIALYAAFYMILHVGYGTTAIPYSDMAQCQKVANEINNDNSKSGRAYCIEGNKP